MTTTTQRSHELKCWPSFFDAIRDGSKTFEVRKNDRGFQKGDILRLVEYDPERLVVRETGRVIYAHVSYVLSGWGVEPGYVAMGLSDVEMAE